MYDVCEGVKVVEVASWTFVPTSGAVLAEWGADVIKVEHPVVGDPQRGLRNVLSGSGSDLDPMLEVPNRGKRSVAIDISTERGRDILYRLVAEADVFTTNYLPAIRARLGIDVGNIQNIKPDIIYARGTGQGIHGAEAERGGFDMAASWSRGGTAFAMTPDGGAPPFQPGSFGDLSGGLTMAGAIAAALFRRERTGKGAVVDVALYATGMWMMSQSITGAPFGRRVPRFTRETTWNPLNNYYETADGRWLCLVMLQAGRLLPDLARHLGREDLLEDPRFNTDAARAEHQAEFIGVLDEIFRTRTLAEWREALATTEGVWAPVLSAEDITHDDQVYANDFFPEVEVGDGSTYRVVGVPAKYDEQPVGPLRRAPEHGEHTETVLVDLGLGWDEIARLKEEAVIV